MSKAKIIKFTPKRKQTNIYDNIDDLDIYVEEDEDWQGTGTSGAQSAFFTSMRHKGCVNLEYMSRISGLSEEELLYSLEGKFIFADPVKYKKCKDYKKSMVSVNQLLSGNLYKKATLAHELKLETGLFAETEEILTRNLPEQLSPGEVYIPLGATWIPTQVVAEFIQFLLECAILPTVVYDDFQGKWNITFHSAPNHVKNNYTYGTLRMDAVRIIKNILHARPCLVYDSVPDYDRNKNVSVLNRAETVAAKDKEQLILHAWYTFIHNNTILMQHLIGIYMEKYGYALTRYNGDYLELEDLPEDLTLYPHQKNAIAHIIMEHNVLLAHQAGSGKTYSYMCGIHELQRLDFSKKALIVVPNDTLEAVSRVYKKLYGTEGLLTVYPNSNFAPKYRKETLKKMMSDEVKVIIMAFSSFDMIHLSKAYKMRKLRTQIQDCVYRIASAKTYTLRDSLETYCERLRKKLEKLEEENEDPVMDCFDFLGIDALVVDEAHNYKNITLDARAENIVGMHSSGAKKADNMLEKVGYVQKVDGHVIFATGTPIPNSLADLFVLMRYLQPEEMKVCNIYHFNDWVNTFCTQDIAFEVDVDCKNYRITTRFSKFHNLPELMAMFSECCDFYQIDKGELGLPDFDGYSDVVIKKSKEQKEYIENLAVRTEHIRAREVKPTEDNLLKITVDGRKCALDVRLVLPETKHDKAYSKVYACASNIAENYFKYPGTTQIAFCDISTPKNTFNMYDELKQQLIELGVKSTEIAFIHDAVTEKQRIKMEEKFNSGIIRVLIGSTMKLGIGANVQEKLIAIHHLDIPWRPADMEQREGRILRQGNTNEKVFIYRYVTEASFDSYSWQILENKQKFIAQFLSGSMSAVHREEEDYADSVLNIAEIKALAIGNPLIRERVETANLLEHTRISQRQKRKELTELREHLARLPKKIKQAEGLVLNAGVDAIFYARNKKSIPNEERLMFGEELMYALSTNVQKEEDRLFQTYQGFEVILPKHMIAEKPYVILRRANSNIYTVKMDGDTAAGCSRRIDYVLGHLYDTKAEYESKFQSLLKEQEQAEMDLERGNEFDKEVQRLMIKLNEIDTRLKEDQLS